MPRVIVECVPNFSEGRDPAVVDAIVASIESDGRAAVLHRTMDPDHHRSVVTFAGAPDAVLDAAVRAIETARNRIDLRSHSGVHPRLGAADVVPLVPIEGITLAECAHLAHALGRRIWSELQIPAYFYEAASLRPDRKNLEDIRRGGFEGIAKDLALNTERAPDVGGPHLHPTAGACIVGARPILIAWNFTLGSNDLTIARRIARAIRYSSGGFRCVKALGLPLESRGRVQVSMNLTDFTQTPLHRVFEAVCSEASRFGVPVTGSEIIGLVPRAAFEAAADYFLRCESFRPDVVLENRLERVLLDRQRQEAAARLRALADRAQDHREELQAILRLIE